MANLYEKASLVLPTSPAYKDGAIQAYKPLTSQGTFDFSRGSNLAATRVDANGLIEKGRENLLLYSNRFDTTWNTVNTSVTSGQTGYDGSNDAWLLTDNTATGSHDVRQSISLSDVGTLSVYAKAGTLNWLRIYDGTSISYFDLSGNGALGTIGAISASIELVGGGWFRCSIVQQNISYALLAVTTGNNISNYTGTGSGSIYIQDAQLEQGLVATDYIETGASTAQAGILEDLPRLDYSGGASCPSLLLEPQRTNVFTDSEYFKGTDWILQDATITNNAAISPEGVQNASLYTSASELYDFVRQNISFVSGTTYTYSVFAKAGTSSLISLGYHSSAFGAGQSATFNLSDGTYTLGSANPIATMEDYGNDWWRCSITATATASTSRSTGFSSSASGAVTTMYLYGAQLEQGSYPTSYIPTYGSAVTRSQDVPTNLSASDLIGSDEGVMFLDLQTPSAI